jgi:hypothetical protein
VRRTLSPPRRLTPSSAEGSRGRERAAQDLVDELELRDRVVAAAAAELRLAAHVARVVMTNRKGALTNPRKSASLNFVKKWTERGRLKTTATGDIRQVRLNGSV